MFTGIIQSIGRVSAVKRSHDGLHLMVSCGKLDLSDCHAGDSIAVNGVCLTVVNKNNDNINVDVSAETLSCTTFSELQVGDKLNLEKSLLPTTRLSGHLVSGHVDGMGRIDDIVEDGDSLLITVTIPPQLLKYIAIKGSICIDGVSLTVNRIEDEQIVINTIPHTQQETIIGEYEPGDQANIEVDIVARYLERLLSFNQNIEKTRDRISDINIDHLGFKQDLK